MRSRFFGRVGGFCALLMLAAAAAGATTLQVALDLQGQGLSMTSGGAGLELIGGGSANVTVISWPWRQPASPARSSHGA